MCTLVPFIYILIIGITMMSNSQGLSLRFCWVHICKVVRILPGNRNTIQTMIYCVVFFFFKFKLAFCKIFSSPLGKFWCFFKIIVFVSFLCQFLLYHFSLLNELYIFLVSPCRKFLTWRIQGSFPSLSIKKFLLSVVDCYIKDFQ